jgi:ubiquinone/menaquinone biosynthesis C-methylase UbiE
MAQYSSDWIHTLENLQHWTYYWHQVELARSVITPGDQILEIGVGTKFTSNYLKSKDHQVTTMDIDPLKDPDIQANIVDHELDDKFDHVLAFEVFEHMPFEDFEKVLIKLHRVCRKNLLISLPRNEKLWLQWSVQWPGRKGCSFRLTTRRRKIISAHHHWEVDFYPYTKNKLEQTFSKHGYGIALFRKVDSLLFYILTTL